MKPMAVLAAALVLAGCSGKVAVMTLEATIAQAALSAQRATNGASKKLSIEVGVSTGYKLSADAPIPVPVVPIDVSASSTTTTKLKLDVDLEKFTPPMTARDAAPAVYLLDTRTGLLTPKRP